MADNYRWPIASFVECDTCRALSGMAPLCGGCLHNRVLEAFLKETLSNVQGTEMMEWLTNVEHFREFRFRYWSGKR